MLTITPALYTDLIAQAQKKANLIDQPVAVVAWNIANDGGCSHELVVCRKGYAGQEDMTRVNELLGKHMDSEIVEIVGPTY
jgi:hypothetical protein